MLSRILLCSFGFSPTNVEHLKPTDDHGGSPMHGRQTEGVRDLSERSVPQPAPTLLHKTPLDVLAGYCSRCGRGTPSAAAVYPPPPPAATAAAADMELGVLDPRSHWNYGSQPFIMSITNIENHNSNALAFRFDPSGKGVYG